MEIISSADNPLMDDEVVDVHSSALAGGTAIFISQATQFALATIRSVIMARLVSPKDFGVYTMLWTFAGFATIFSNLGLSIATIQRKNITHDQVSMLFWINAGVGVLLAVLTAGLAPGVAWFYKDPRLTPLLGVFAVNFILTGMTVQHRAILARRMKFLLIETVDVAGMLLSTIIMIAAAWRGAGYWSYVYGDIANYGLTMVFFWLALAWRPGLPKLRSGARGMVISGGHLSGFNITNYIHRTCDNILVGRYCGSMELGFYNRAYGLLMLPLRQVFQPIRSLMVPALSRLQDDPRKYRDYALNGQKIVASLAMPLVAFTFVDTREVILFMAGPQWLEAVPLFRALAPAAFATTANAISGWIFQSLGETDRMFKAGVALCVVVCLAFVLGLRWGAIGVATAYSIAYTLSLYPYVAYSLRRSPVTMKDLLSALWRPAFASLAAAGLLFWFKPFLPSSTAFVKAALDALIYLILYLFCWVSLPGGTRFLLELIGPMGRFLAARRR